MKLIKNITESQNLSFVKIEIALNNSTMQLEHENVRN